MPAYRVVVELIDAFERQGRKTFVTKDSIADFDAAKTAAAGLMTDLGNLTKMRILAYSVSERVVYTDTVEGDANKDEGLTLSLRKADNYVDVIRVPAPILTIFDAADNADVNDAAVAAFASNFFSGGDFTFSDGEVATEIVRGKLDK